MSESISYVSIVGVLYCINECSDTDICTHTSSRKK